ncbi:MAG: DegT/DnrJ/EryC1/StrS family aminotransferase [Dehalococcoidales bacterium]|nr:DegT/DnrJ/EryC1/StrS family aminotransferase [Dehalococcoidales bacterium]
MVWKIALSDIDLDEQEINAVTDVLESKWLTMGEITQQFETAFKKYLGIKYAFAVSNCTAALHIAHTVLNIKEGDEVICPSLTFIATANSILYTGATPVFSDIMGFDNLNVSPEDIRRKITRKTKAITVVHYGGNPCEMNEILEIAREHNLKVIEDAAHAPGADYKGKKCGTIGDIGCFSFFSNKNMATGEGGMIVTNNDELGEKIRLLRSHGMTTLTLDRHKGHAYSYDVTDLGYNYRIDEMRSALGLVQLKKLEKNNRRRKHIVDEYQRGLKELKEISIPFNLSEGTSSNHIFPVLLQKGTRDRFMEKLKERGIQTSIHYPPIHLFRYYRDRFGYKQGTLPFTEEIGEKEVTLPLHPIMTDGDVKYIVNSIKEIL